MANRFVSSALAAALVSVGVLFGGVSPAGADEPGVSYRPDEINTVKIADGAGGWTNTECSVFPIDNVWHSEVTDPSLTVTTDLASVAWGTPTDRELRSRFGVGSPYYNQANQNQIPGNHGHGVNVVSTNESDRRFQIGSQFENASEWNQRTPVLWTFDYFMRHEAPPLSGLKWQDMAWGIPFLNAPDNHMYFIDVNSNASALDQGATCIGYEYISFNPVASGSGTYKVDHGTAYDLDRNTRRLSAELASNASYPLPVPFSASYSSQVRKVKNATSAQGGSGLSGLGGMIRVDEVFANSTPGDGTVRATGGIDHVLGAVLPQGLIRSQSTFGTNAWTWPATNSDGQSTDPVNSVAMGSRLRLKTTECAALSTTFAGQPQAEIIARALCDHGAMIIDSAGAFGLYGQMSDKWDPAQMQALAALTLDDFEIVDVTPMRQVLGGADCRTNWSDPVPAVTPKPCNRTNWLAVN